MTRSTIAAANAAAQEIAQRYSKICYQPPLENLNLGEIIIKHIAPALQPPVPTPEQALLAMEAQQHLDRVSEITKVLGQYQNETEPLTTRLARHAVATIHIRH